MRWEARIPYSGGHLRALVAMPVIQCPGERRDQREGCWPSHAVVQRRDIMEAERVVQEVALGTSFDDLASVQQQARGLGTPELRQRQRQKR